jgi:hypothetical protein
VVKRFATSTSPFLRAPFTNGPEESRDLNSLNSTPYTSRRPTTPTSRVFTSGAAPMTSLPFCFFRSARDARPYLSAVSRVTTNASESSALPYGST